jgi:hypothetical protein
MIGSSDGHDGIPGDSQSPETKHHHIYHFCGSGRAAVLANQLTRDDVYDALYDRRCYATTGSPIKLEFTAAAEGKQSVIMGQQIKSSRSPLFNISVEGTNGISQIRIVKNGHVVFHRDGYGRRDAVFEWHDDNFTADASYYVRVVQADYESAWSSPIWIEREN